jgi:hypothetical protein
MTTTGISRRKFFWGLPLPIVLLTSAGCGSGQSVPTKIYEGGGTIPEIVEQPEPPAGKKAAQPTPKK